MNEYTLIIFPIVLKISQLIVGLFFAYFGYRLLSQGLFGETSDLEAKWKDFSLLMKKASPGTFFALFGSAIVIISIYTHSSFEVTPMTLAISAPNALANATPSPTPNYGTGGGSAVTGGFGNQLKAVLAPVKD